MYFKIYRSKRQRHRPHRAPRELRADQPEPGERRGPGGVEGPPSMPPSHHTSNALLGFIHRRYHAPTLSI